MSEQGRALWFTRLASAFRTALACSIVACATLYGPASLRRQVAFPAFSYLTAILIVTEAALGDAVRGCCLALYATLHTVFPAMFLFWLIGPAKFSPLTTALAVALASVVVVLPSSTHVLAKRIALGQIVIIYVVGFIGGVHTDPLMHPLHVAATTALGAAASVGATLLPFPRLASLQVKKKRKAMAENMVERLKLLVKAVLTDDDTVAAGSISKAQLLSSSATKLLQSIQIYQESMQWERLPFKINSERVEDLVMTLTGMESALSSIPSYPIQNLQNQTVIKDDLNALENHITLTLKQTNASSPSDSLTFPEFNIDHHHTIIKSIQIMPTNHQDLPHHFFIFCMMKLLQILSKSQQMKKKEKTTTWVSSMNSQQLIPPLKFAISLGIAVILGLMYSKENGFWASLAVAVSIASDREPTFKVANVKFHGTMLGSVYGILSFVLFHRFLVGRLLCLIPWFIFTSFLQHSKIYGSAGGMSAIIGAVVILGRTNYGSPREFAFTRTVETFIGLLVSILVDVLFHPMRASKMAKIQFQLSLQTLQKCFELLSFESSTLDLENSQRDLRIQVSELKKLIDEAEVEPNFWFLPFQSCCYGKLFKSLSKMADFFAFNADAMNNLKENNVLKTKDYSGRKVLENLEGDFEKFKEMLNNALKSLKVLEKEVEKNGDFGDDLEMGDQPERIVIEEIKRIEKEKLIINSFLQHSAEVVDQIRGSECESKDGKSSEAILSLSAMAFCLSGLMKEIEEIGEATKRIHSMGESFYSC